MIELKRLKLINWHNFENVTFDCARLTYMIGVNAVGKTTILDAIRYCLTTNRSFNALGNKKSGRTLQGSVHAKQRGENAYRRPGRTVAYIGAEFWDSAKRTPFVIAVRVESEGPMQELHPGDQTWYLSEDGCTLEQLPFIDPRTGAPSSKENFKPAVGRLSYTRSPGEARDRICRALGIGRASSPLGKKFNEVFQMGTSMDEIPNFREFLYQYILPQPELDLEALQGDRVELENLHAVLAEAQTRADALDEIVRFGREATEKQTEALVNRGAALLADADCIIYAGSLVNPALLGLAKPGCAIYNSAEMTLEQVLDVMHRVEAAGGTTVRLHTGDPCLYGAIREQMDALDADGIPYDDTPGVSSFCGAAAALRAEYTLPNVSQTVIITRAAGRTPVPERESIRSLAAHQATMVLFLSTSLTEKLQGELLAGGYGETTPAAVVYKATWPEEKIFRCTVGTLHKTVTENGMKKTALIVVGGCLGGEYLRSLLYHPDFTTEYRKGKA